MGDGRGARSNDVETALSLDQCGMPIYRYTCRAPLSHQASLEVIMKIDASFTEIRTQRWRAEMKPCGEISGGVLGRYGRPGFATVICGSAV